MPTATENIEKTGTPIAITSYPDIDELIRQIANRATRNKVQAYVYGNLTARPKLTVSANKRAIYGIMGGQSAFQYSLTDLDIAWLTRSLMGEGGSDRTGARLHGWAMFNRFMFVFHNSFKTFWRYILDFSQPVNPKWRRDGIMCGVGGKHYGEPEHCSAHKLARRDRMAFGKLTQPQIGFAEELAVGTLEPPEKSYINFGGTPYGIKHGERVHGEWYLTKEQDVSMKWPSGTVVKLGVRNALPIDTVTPLTHNQLLAFVTAKLEGDQRATSNGTTTRGEINARASVQAQQNAAYELRQGANVSQMTDALHNGIPATFGAIGMGVGGLQVGSDDTWNRV